MRNLDGCSLDCGCKSVMWYWWEHNRRENILIGYFIIGDKNGGHGHD